MYSLLFLVSALKLSAALPTGQVAAGATSSKDHLVMVIVLGSLLGLSLSANLIFCIFRFCLPRASAAIAAELQQHKQEQEREQSDQIQQSRQMQPAKKYSPSIFERKEPSLDNIIEDGDLCLLKSFMAHRSTNFDLHEAARLACKYYQADVLTYLDGITANGDSLMETLLEKEVKFIGHHSDKRHRLINCLARLVRKRSLLDPALLFWAIQHSDLKVVNILLHHPKSRHLNLNTSLSCPAPIMACFLRSGTWEARQILINLWQRTLHQPCDVDPEVLRNAVCSWGDEARPVEQGQKVSRATKTEMLDQIAHIENVKRCMVNQTKALDRSGAVDQLA